LRYKGYKLALARAGRQFAARLVPAHMTADTAYEAMRSFIDDGGEFDAVFAATDVIAISAIRALAASGLEVPRNVAVVGFDDIALAEYTNPRLTTVRQNIRHGAHTLVDLLFRRLNGEDTPSATMAAELVVRDSSAAATESGAPRVRRVHAGGQLPDP
jgi:DNA-binding LacI/PurR family transcriptional regulator